MTQIVSKNLELNKNKKPLELLGKKTILFRIEKYSDQKKKSSLLKYTEDYSNEGRWSYAEQIQFINALSKEGPNWKRIKQIINCRTLTQIRSHAQKLFLRFKRCKNAELGIDFTNNSIKNFKDMINHIKFVNNSYDINNVFLYLSDINQKSLAELSKKVKEDELPNLIASIVGCNYKKMSNEQDVLLNKNNINITYSRNQIFNKDNNKANLNNDNNMILLNSLNNMNNNLNVFILNYLNNIRKTNNLISKLYNIYLENINKALFNVSSFSTENNNNSNIDKNECNINNH